MLILQKNTPMKDVEIERTGIVIIEWLRPEDPKLGQELYNDIKYKETEDGSYFVTLYSVSNKVEFTNTLQKIIDSIKEGTLLTLHIVAHGCEDGLGTDLGNFVDWKELFSYTRQLNIILQNTLLLVLSSCVGGGILSYIEPEKRAPYMAFIANTRSVLMKDARNGFPLFYKDYRTPLDFHEALLRLNGSIDFAEEIEPGVKKTEFFIMSASHTFDEVFNPDRDIKHFNSVVDKIMPPNPLIPQELRLEKARELFIAEGKRLKPYFMFQK